MASGYVAGSRTIHKYETMDEIYRLIEPNEFVDYMEANYPDWLKKVSKELLKDLVDKAFEDKLNKIKGE
jgi:vacuolar-type H+-ATPase subunit C/Vma6